ncbi:MAG: tRNA 2-thiouridine(34) synthase MnmA [Polyangiaceae bacterium]|nr:tRNA 2-thiouridine(34) synthase MnmA [Polyangiaceae bacterium]
MSGGVDSSVAAALLKAAGYEVVGATLRLWDTPDDGTVQGRCCAPEDVHDARRVADHLGIAHYAFDRRAEFRRLVVEPFVEDYLKGHTPSPCVTCNRTIKIRELLGLADRLSADVVATGHYARVVEEAGAPTLWRGVDRNKDQSYFLHMLGAESLSRLNFPLGGHSKQQVRSLARQWRLPGAGKGESQQLCFVQTARYADFVAEHAPDRIRPGLMTDPNGREVAKHAGVHAFTVGQRHNLGVALGYRAYVVGIDGASSTVRVGPRELLLCSSAELEELVLHSGTELPLRAEVAVRYRGRAYPATVKADSRAAAIVDFDEPVAAVVPGQYAVFYQDERVLGGARISRAVQCEGLLP